MLEATIKLEFSIKRFHSSREKDFLKALMIYNSITPVDTKTSSNEIMYFVDHSDIQPNREMYFFGLYADDEIVGFIETGYLKTTKTIIIDYIVLKESHRLNSIFYPLFSLVQRYFSEHMIDYDYIATEISTKCPEESVDAESFFSRKMLQMEDFRVIDLLYRQPKLGLDNEESNFDFELMIKSAQPVVKIKKHTYLAIVYDIYFEHYYPWYAVSDPERMEEYREHLEEEYSLVKMQIDKNDGDIILSQNAPVCAYYKAPDCHFNNSTAGFVVGSKIKRGPILLLGIPFISALAFVIALCIYIILDKMQIKPDAFAGIFAAITAVCTGLFSLTFSVISKPKR